MNTDTIPLQHLPKHVAIIMDGNGRWAKAHKLQVSLGHKAGTESLREIIRLSSDLSLTMLTLYAFSTENWRRSKTEVAALMQLILDFFNSEIDELCQKQVCIRILGDLSALPIKQQDVLHQAMDRTKLNSGLVLNIAINYGARAEIVEATKKIVQEVQNGTLNPQDITEETISQHLTTQGGPDVDLLIRTSGEMRLSNFLLYQCAYAEFIFPTVLWPDFTKEQYMDCLMQYSTRNRRFGGR